jgi:hypothetical protein
MILASILLAGTPIPPSFDCTRAKLPVERLICADVDLAIRDRALALIYASMPLKTAHLRRYQRLWLSERNACVSIACIRRAYDERIALWASSGRYSEYFRHESYVGGLSIAPVADGWHVFTLVTAGTGPDGKSASVDLGGVVELKDGIGRWRQSAGCSVEISRIGRRWRVRQDPGCGPLFSGLSLDGQYLTERDWWAATDIEAAQVPPVRRGQKE